LLRPLDCGELRTEIVGPAFVELVLVEVGGTGCRILTRDLAVVGVAEPAQRLLDPKPLGSQELARPICVHVAQLTAGVGLAERLIC
jgi:hypothetical protein